MKEITLINTCWLKPFADYFGERGISLSPYCDSAQIELSQVNSGEGWITKHQLYLFLDSLAKGENMPEVGFVVGEIITPDCLGDLGKAMAQAETLGGVIRTFCELINRHVEGNECRLEEGDDGEIWFFNTKSQSPDPGRLIADHAGLMSMINLARLIGGREWYPSKACLQTPATSVYRKVEGLRTCELKFDQEAAGFSFPAQWLLRSTKTSMPQSVSAHRSDGLLQEGEPVAAKLELLLKEIIGVGGICPTIKLMSELCDTSARTLHRQLKSSGSSYQEILDRVRYQQACDELTGSEISIKELAYKLGYSGSNNFVRAFKRLSGTTPAHYRDQKGRVQEVGEMVK
ncbi:AraC family transcriptional regulator ligand-binding domain-containing protein [Haloferula sp.]|uniref:AraC family transcriptional regulator n=1 Tax=Haloferula sp. TaxID=2497595 RepID=UPI00329B5E45